MASKLIIYGVFFGALFGLFMGIITIPIYDNSIGGFVLELTLKDLEAHNVPSETINTTINILKTELASIKYWMPIAELINYVIYGLIIGGIAHLFWSKTRVSEPIALLLSFLVVSGLLVLLLYGINVYYGGIFIELLLKYIPRWYLILSYFGYLAVYMLFLLVKGPWEQWLLGGPKHY